MATKDMTLKKVGDLIRLANEDNGEESRTAAMQATKLIAENKLVLVPQSELERVERMVEGVKSLAKKHEGDTNMKMGLALVAGMMLSKQGLL